MREQGLSAANRELLANAGFSDFLRRLGAYGYIAVVDAEQLDAILDAARSEARPVTDGVREGVARLIDPALFRTLDSQAGFPPESIERYQNRAAAEAFAKADAILALIAASPVQGESAWRPVSGVAEP